MSILYGLNAPEFFDKSTVPATSCGSSRKMPSGAVPKPAGIELTSAWTDRSRAWNNADIRESILQVTSEAAEG